MKSSLNQQFFNELAIELRDYVLPAESELIRQELELHIEERRAQLLEMGLSEVEAEAAAIAALGSPAEIARPYASVNSPGRKLNILATGIGLLASFFFYSFISGALSHAAILALCLGFTAWSTWLGVQGARNGYALTFGRLLNFAGWVSIMGLVSLLVQQIPSETKVAVTIPVSQSVNATKLYKAPDNRYVLSLSEGPTASTAYLIFTREPAAKDTPLLPAAHFPAYFKEAKFAYATVDKSIQRDFRNNTKRAVVLALTGGVASALICGTAALIWRRPRRSQPSKSPPLRPTQPS
jgi:hypothetical protein